MLGTLFLFRPLFKKNLTFSRKSNFFVTLAFKFKKKLGKHVPPFFEKGLKTQILQPFKKF